MKLSLIHIALSFTVLFASLSVSAQVLSDDALQSNHYLHSSAVPFSNHGYSVGVSTPLTFSASELGTLSVGKSSARSTLSANLSEPFSTANPQLRRTIIMDDGDDEESGPNAGDPGKPEPIGSELTLLFIAACYILCSTSLSTHRLSKILCFSWFRNVGEQCVHVCADSHR